MMFRADQGEIAADYLKAMGVRATRQNLATLRAAMDGMGVDRLTVTFSGNDTLAVVMVEGLPEGPAGTAFGRILKPRMTTRENVIEVVIHSREASAWAIAGNVAQGILDVHEPAWRSGEGSSGDVVIPLDEAVEIGIDYQDGVVAEVGEPFDEHDMVRVSF